MLAGRTHWIEGPLLARARALGVRVQADAGGRLARRLGVTTSGTLVVGDAAGRVRFHGGLTPGRGHEGRAGGRRRVEELLRGHGHGGRFPVYGCPIFEEETT